MDKKLVIINSVLVVLSILLVFFGVSANASTLYFLPQSQDTYSGETFVLDARIDTEGKAVNVIKGIIKYPSDKIEVVDMIDGDSIISLWVEKPASSAQEGEISFTGGVPKGFSGQGDILKVVFRSKAENLSGEEINFSDKTKVLLNDGSGTEDQLNYLSSSFKISEKPAGLPIITSRSHPNQDTWYKSKDLNLHWDLKDGARYSYLLSRDPLVDVDEIPDKPEGDKVWMGDMSFRGLEDGIYYFHLKQKLQGEEWSKKVTYRAMIDAMPPENFTPKIAEIEGKKYVVFNTRDVVSGIDHYELIEAEKRGLLSGETQSEEWKVAKSPYLLSDQKLESVIKVKAVDKAGNETFAEIQPKQKQVPANILFVILLIVLITAGFICLVKFSRRNLKFKR